jgi:hypothetical protein
LVTLFTNSCTLIGALFSVAVTYWAFQNSNPFCVPVLLAVMSAVMLVGVGLMFAARFGGEGGLKLIST